MFRVDAFQDLHAGTIRYLVQTGVDLRETGGVKGIGVEIQGTCLKGRLEDIGHVGEENVVEEVAE